jgi:hypothetical protein
LVKTKKILYFLFLITLFNCNHYNEKKLKIVNKSKEDLFIDFRFEKNLQLWDTINSQGDTLKINDSLRPPNRELWEKTIIRNSKDSTLYLLIVKKQLFKKKNWKKIVAENNFILKPYTIRELDSLKWIVNYVGK